eukprot:scaffold22063_cov23-Prasinocladus_malaysianus.AAC.1
MQAEYEYEQQSVRYSYEYISADYMENEMNRTSNRTSAPNPPFRSSTSTSVTKGMCAAVASEKLSAGS